VAAGDLRLSRATDRGSSSVRPAIVSLRLQPCTAARQPVPAGASGRAIRRRFAAWDTTRRFSLQKRRLRPVFIDVSLSHLATDTQPEPRDAERVPRDENVCRSPSRTFRAPCASPMVRNERRHPIGGSRRRGNTRLACAWSFGRDPNRVMNDRGHPATLRCTQPGNRNAVKSGIYSQRVRAERAEGMRAAAIGTS
jgi:hypothetical protein